MTLLIPKDVLDSKISRLDNPKRTHLISAASLPIIAFQNFRDIRVFFSEVLNPEKNHSQYYCSSLLYIWYILLSFCSRLLFEMAVVSSVPCSSTLLCTCGGTENTEEIIIFTYWRKLSNNIFLQVIKRADLEYSSLKTSQDFLYKTTSYINFLYKCLIFITF